MYLIYLFLLNIKILVTSIHHHHNNSFVSEVLKGLITRKVSQAYQEMGADGVSILPLLKCIGPWIKHPASKQKQRVEAHFLPMFPAKKLGPL